MFRQVKIALAATAALLIVTPASAATVVLTQTLNQSLGGTVYNGSFDVAGLLSDADGRTFSITGARLTATGYADPVYGARTVLTTIQSPFPIFVGVEDVGGQPVAVFENRTTDVAFYLDDVADGIMLIADFATATGFASLTLAETGQRVLSSSDGPVTTGAFGPQILRTTYDEQFGRSTIYGPIEVALDIGASGLFSMNVGGPLQFSAAGFFGEARLTGATLSLDLTQTGGPPPGSAPVPEPATWAMLILGFATTGAMLRARRLNPALSPARRRPRSSR